jgi:dCTP deaminase
VKPNDFVLANIEENISVPKGIVGTIHGRSTYGRLGLEVHSTAGLIDPGFEGDIVLEISNNANHPIVLYRGDRVAQIVFNRLDSECDVGYGEKDDQKYQHQQGAVGSRVWEDHHDE